MDSGLALIYRWPNRIDTVSMRETRHSLSLAIDILYDILDALCSDPRRRKDRVLDKVKLQDPSLFDGVV